MKNTRYIFDEQKYTPEGMVSVSQIQTFLSCRKKWEYSYIENIRPRVERSYLTIGKLCHKGMQVAMQNAWKDKEAGLDTSFEYGFYKSWMEAGFRAMEEEHRKYMAENDFLKEEMLDVEKMLDDAEDVFEQAYLEFKPWNYDVLTIKKDGKLIPALELHFKIPCPPTKGLHGYIDAILIDKTTGFIWCTDYKFRKSLAPDEDEANNIQNAVYAYACKKMGIPITGTMTWQHVNTPAAVPTLLKNGTVSRAKIKTTWETYLQFCLDHDLDPENYREEMQEKLADIEWYRATYEYRNDVTLTRIWNQCIAPVAKQIKSAHGKKAVNFRSLYPWNCKMCQYQSLCQAELRDYDADQVRKLMYTEYTKNK